MLHRPESEGLVVVSQPAHAWVSAQLAAGWGGSVAGFRPDEELRVAVEHHDDGWLDWEVEPELNPETGRPYSYLDLPTETHLEIFDVGVDRARALGRYPALLVSRHATGLVRRHHRPGSEQERRRARRFLERQDRIQEALRGSLAAEPDGAPVDDDSLRRASDLMSTWDALSLELCGGLRERQVLDEVPLASGPAPLTLEPVGDAAVAVDPWPFRRQELEIVFEGRRLGDGHPDTERMREALRTAPWVRYRIHLTPGR